jgi:DNA-binding NarL/FixJ family response regulator
MKKRNEVTKKEKIVGAMLCQGFDTKVIASELKVSPKTIQSHICNMFKKKRVNNRVSLVNFFRRKSRHLPMLTIR